MRHIGKTLSKLSVSGFNLLIANPAGLLVIGT